MAGTMHDSTLRYLCVGCGHLRSITSAEFGSLPPASDEHLVAARLVVPGAPTHKS